MPIKPFEIVDFGGTDSRSNPLNMPQNRALRMLNWCPKPDGHLELRWGYGAEVQSNVQPQAIHSLIPFQTWSGNKNYLIVGQANLLTIHDLRTSSDTAAVIRGTPLTPVELPPKWGYYPANNRIHLGNGIDQKFFDGTTFRDNGLRAPTAAEVSGIGITEGVREYTTAEASSITLTAAAGGTFPATTGSGRSFFSCFFDPTDNELGPATIAAGSGRVTLTLNQKVTYGTVPVSSNLSWIHLFGFTEDGGSTAYFATTGINKPIASCTKTAVFTPGNPPSIPATTSYIVTVTCPNHGLSSPDMIYQFGSGFDGVYVIHTIDVNTYYFTLSVKPGGADLPIPPPQIITGGTMFQLIWTHQGVTTVAITSPLTVSPTNYPAVFTSKTPLLMNRDSGLPAVAAGLANSGYQFYIAIYNPTTQHVGNRIAIGSRHVNTARVNIIISGLPDYSQIDSEWEVLIGRTGDGAQIPYVIADDADNFIAAASGQTQITISNQIDGNFEMPTRNGVIHPECTMFARVGTKSYAADPGSPTVRISGDESDDTTGIFLGRPEQSWADNDIETFPTSAPVRGIAENDYELAVGTLRDTAILSDQNGQRVWKGPWNVGWAGPRAWCKASPYGFFWLTDRKELATFANGLPTPISDEYEAGTLAQISDSFLGDVELTYFRDPAKNKDEIRIEGKDSSGVPITVIHDFKLRDERSPFGQGYLSQYQGPLGNPFTSVQARDSSNKLTIYAGDNAGFLYRLYQGADDVGNEYDADAIFLANAGPNRPDVPYIDFFGDSQIKVSVGRTLATTADTFEELSPGGDGPMSVPGEEDDALWRAHLLTPEIHSHVYLRFQLTSHSADGDLSLNNPPHLPLETYGRLYEIVPIMGDTRGK
jgi:hypothetical protein